MVHWLRYLSLPEEDNLPGLSAAVSVFAEVVQVDRANVPGQLRVGLLGPAAARSDANPADPLLLT